MYATDGYRQSVTNLGRVTLASDNVFGDDSAARELATVTGDVTAGCTATLTIVVDPSGTEAATGGGNPPGGGGTPPGGGGPHPPQASAVSS